MTGPLPAARHLVALNRVRADAGGQTTAALQRTRLFAEEAGTGTTVLTFDAFPAYAEAEASLRERGVLHPDVRLRNVYDDLRERAWPEPTGATEELADLGDLRRVDEHRADGSLWRVRWDNPVNLEPLFHDYVRDDGSVSVRAAAPLSLDEFPRRPGLVQVVDPAGRVRESHETQGAFFASWVHHLVADDETVVLFHDSMMVPPHLTPELDERVRQVAVLHVAHVYAPRHWNSPAHPPAARTLAHLDRLDALVTLTERQRADIALGHGDRTNLFVRPNPAEPTEVPDPRPARDPKRFSVIARMERVKRVDDAVRAFAQVVEQEPDAVLDVYGDGSLRPRLEDLVRELGVDGSVVLHGHRPDAPQRLWESSGLLLTSRSEGFPLAPLEAAVRECPVVAYDIKYGPREQVEDGGTGYLVPAGDVAALARRVVDLARSPADVARMGARARERVLA
ncbi:MAG: glycosyltransferase, partial [Nocardioidaceae bacterium]|nr:glycosyltransferase [Nocardioidaceae bacterium]